MMYRKVALLISFALVLGLLSNTASAVDPNLVGHWTFDDGTADDSSGYSHHGTLNNGPLWQPSGGRFGGALSFDEVDDYLEIPDFNYTNDIYEFSLCFWFKIDDVAGSLYQYMFSHGDWATNNSLNVYLRESSASSPEQITTNIKLNDGTQWQLNTGIALADGQWHMYAITVSSADGAEIFIDANSIGTDSTIKGSSFNPGTNIHLGSCCDYNIDRYFGNSAADDGLLDDVRLYNRILSPGEIAELARIDPNKAWCPYPEDGQEDVSEYSLTLTWKPGDNVAATAGHKVYFGTDKSLIDSNDVSVYKATRDVNNWPTGYLDYHKTYYWKVNEVNGVSEWPGIIWEFKTKDAKATNPHPVDGAIYAPLEPVLSWSPGRSVADSNGHDVYFGTDYNAVAGANHNSDEFLGNFDVNSCSPDCLKAGTTYYWAVDEVNGPNTWPGDVWSFTASTPEADPNFIGWWKFDEKSGDNVWDATGREHHGTFIVGDTNTSISIVYDADRDSNVLDVDNPPGHTINSVVDCGTGDWADIQSAITLAVWTKVHSIHTTCYLMTKGSPYQMTGLAAPDGRFRAFNNNTVNPGNGLNQATYSTSSLLDGEWHHVAVTYDSIAQERKVYFDGVLEDEEPVTGLLGTTSNAFVIGGRLTTGYYHRGWDGWIDDVRLYNRILSPGEIAELGRINPNKAWFPYPEDGQEDVSEYSLTLTWRPGDNVAATAGHDVYFGTDKVAVENADTSDLTGVYRGRQDTNSYGPLSFTLDEIYYWRIDEVNDTQTWKGNVWSFTVKPDLAVNLSMESDFIYQDPLGQIAQYWTGWRAGGWPQGYFSEGSYAHDGSKSQEIYWNGWGYGSFGPDGIYQQIGSIQLGKCYRASFWFKLRFGVTGFGMGHADGHGDITCSIGVDPNGGAEPGVVTNWSSVSESVWAWEYEGNGDMYDGPWLNAVTFFSPKGNTATIFIRVHGWADAMGFVGDPPACPDPPCEYFAEWHLECYIDDVVVELVEIGESSTVEATSPVPANGASYSEVTITVVDPNGNPVEKIPASEIVVDCTGSGNTITGPEAPTDENGQTRARITSTVAEIKTVSVTVLGTVLSDTATVEFGEGYFGPDWYVDASNIGYWNGSPEHPFRSISEAIIPAQNGDKIIVLPGTYYENVDFSGKAIIIRSTDPNDPNVVQATVIDGGGNDSVVLFKNSEGADSVLSGFTITGGQAYRGGGIYCEGSVSPTITNNIITNNTASSNGGGIYGGSNSIIKNNIIMGNAAAYGGGIYNCDGTISNCVIINNTTVGSGYGGGLYDCDGSIVNCTIAANSARKGGGLSYCNGSIQNCIIWNNQATYQGTQQLNSCSTPTYSNVEGGCSGEGCIDSDPYFVDPANGDYHLQPWSPCIDAGTNDPLGGLPATDVEGTNRLLDGDEDGTAIADMGAYECLPHPELHIRWHQPSGSVIGPVDHIDVKFDEPINSATFTEEDIVIIRPDGARVPLAGQPVHQGGNIWRVHFQPQSLVGHYELQVGPQIEDLDGNEMDHDTDHVPGEMLQDQYIGTFVIEGPKIIKHSPVGTKRGPINSISFIFEHPMDTNSFSPSEDIVSFTGPEGTISITNACWSDPCTLEVTFDVQYVAGEYEMVVGPYILNIASNPLDQDGDGIAGEFPDDCYEVSFALTYWSGHIGDTTWQLSPIIVDGALTIRSSGELTIEPGVVVKFLNSSSKIDVDGGFLEVRGTVDKPVILTSFKDDSAGGDTNRDANSTAPNPGDWYGIELSLAVVCTPSGIWCWYDSSRAHLENVEIRYASKGIDADAWEANVVLRNAILRDGGFGIYVYSPYVEIEAENCLIVDNAYTGVFVRADSRHIFRNCTIVGNGFGGSGWNGAGVHLGGADLTLDNCIVAFNKNGLHHSGDPPAVTVRHCDFYNPAGQEIIWDGDPGEPQLDQNGNTIGDPNFVDYSAGNYELADGSPAIDTGRGIHAPYQDILGRDRYDDRGMFNIGTGYPCYIDIGAFERQQDTAAGDLTVTFVSAPDPEIVSVGDSFTAEWTVANIGTLDCNAPWQDVVYLSDDPYFSSDDFVLETRDHNESLIPGASYTETLTTTVPAVSGPQYVLVCTDANESLLEAAQANNEGVSSGVLAVDVPLLEIGTPQTGMASRGEWRYYRFEGQLLGRTVRFTLDSAVGSWQLYLRRALPPTMSDYDVAGAQEMRLLEPIEGTYYVGIYAHSLPGGSTSYTLSAELTELDIRHVSPGVVGNAGHATIKIEGDNFDPNAEVRLIGLGGAIDGEEWYQDRAVLFATFDLGGAGAAPGHYDVVVTNPGPESVTAYDAVTVEDGGAAIFTANLVVPGLARPGRTIELRVEYANTGNIDLPSPLVRLQAGAEDYQWQLPDWDHLVVGRNFHVMALSSDGPAGILRPNQAESLVVRLQIPFRPHVVMLSLNALSSSDTHWGDTVDWEAIMGEPDSSISNPEVWQAFWSEFSTSLGETWKSLVTNVASHASYLSSFGLREYSIKPLLQDFAMASLYSLSEVDTVSLDRSMALTHGVHRSGELFPSQPHDVPITCINRTEPDPEKDSLYIIHGMDGSPAPEDLISEIISAAEFLYYGGYINANINVVDWSSLADSDDWKRWKQVISTNAMIAGERMADWHKKKELYRPGTTTTVIGYSAGAPVAGHFGESLRDMQLPRPRTIFAVSSPPYTNYPPRSSADTLIYIKEPGLLANWKQLGDVNILVRYPESWDLIKWHFRIPFTFGEWMRAFTSMIRDGVIPESLRTRDWQTFDPIGIRLEITPEDLRQFLNENDFGIWWSDDWPLSKVPLEEYLQTKFSVMTSFTPEDKFGPAGYDAPGTPEGSEMRYIPAGQSMSYRIEFWNKEDAPVPTQDAIIEDTLDPNIFDLSTLEFTRIGFLKWDMPLPGGQVIDTRIDCQPEMDIAVEVTGNFDPETGKIFWWFHCVDPMTGDYPEDPMAGFLPPYNPDTGYEIGWVEFRVEPKPDLPSGTQITNQAFVEFDFAGDLYDHPAPKQSPWINTIDACAPSSYVLPLPDIHSEPNFPIEWTGQDDVNGSGIARYGIYVSVDDGEYVLWLSGTNDTSAVFNGEDGHSYAFYSVAYDNVGNVEGAPAQPDTRTRVGSNRPPIANADHDQTVECACNTEQGTKVVLDGINSSDPDGDPLTYTWTGPFVESPAHGPASTITLLDGCPGDYIVTLVVNDGKVDSEPDHATITVQDTTSPVISGVPADDTVECDAVPAPVDPIAIDNCDTDVPVSFNETRTDGDCPNRYTLTRTWTATDDCGNSTTETQIITVVDTTSPMLTIVPEDVNVWRDGNGNIAELNAWLASVVEAIDNCGSVAITNDYVSFPYDCGNTGSLTVTWTATDECGNTTTMSATFTIDDPTAGVTYDGDLLLSTEGAATLDASLTAILRDDAGNLLDIDGEDVTFTLTAEGVGTIVETAVTQDGVAGIILPLEPAIYMVEVTLGCSDFTSFAILVVYNPEGGFATGGGWLVPLDDGLNTYPNQRANFGFNAKYKKGDPTGHIEFRYSDGHIDLKSTSVDQLVITGGKIVQFKGLALVNGVSGYSYFVKGIDEGQQGTSDVFDIKIWAPGVSTEGDPTERAGGTLSGGNIVVHTK